MYIDIKRETDSARDVSIHCLVTRKCHNNNKHIRKAKINRSTSDSLVWLFEGNFKISFVLFSHLRSHKQISQNHLARLSLSTCKNVIILVCIVDLLFLLRRKDNGGLWTVVSSVLYCSYWTCCVSCSPLSCHC